MAHAKRVTAVWRHISDRVNRTRTPAAAVEQAVKVAPFPVAPAASRRAVTVICTPTNLTGYHTTAGRQLLPMLLTSRLRPSTSVPRRLANPAITAMSKTMALAPRLAEKRQPQAFRYRRQEVVSAGQVNVCTGKW